jgi:hypothetical protein
VTDVNSDLSQLRPISVRQPRASRTHAPSQPRSSAAGSPTLHELMSPEQNVQRIMWTGTIWFAAAIGAVAVALGLLLSSGWRPALLTGGVRVLWWAASAVVTLAIGLIGWSGCPILEVDVPTASRNKSLTMQLGTMLFILGTAAAMFAVLLGP